MELIELAKTALDAAGIEIPLPRLQICVDEVKAPVRQEAAALARGEHELWL